MPEDFAAPDDGARIREKAYELWQAEGEPSGRADAHWTMAREMVAIEDSLDTTLLPIGGGEPVEPAIALDNQGEFPGMADQGEESPTVPARVTVSDSGEAAPAARSRPRQSARR